MQPPRSTLTQQYRNKTTTPLFRLLVFFITAVTAGLLGRLAVRLRGQLPAGVYLSVGVHVFDAHELLEPHGGVRLVGAAGGRGGGGRGLVHAVESAARGVHAGPALLQVLLRAQLQLACARQVQGPDQVRLAG